MMNVSDFFSLLRKSDTILSPKQTRDLEEMLAEYPYFQTARALYLKGLKNLESYNYNKELKITAAHTTDREVLFDFITSRDFDQNKIANNIIGRDRKLEETDTIAEVVEPSPTINTFLGESDEEPLPQRKKHADDILDPKLFSNKEDKQEIEDDVESSDKLKSEETTKVDGIEDTIGKQVVDHSNKPADAPLEAENLQESPEEQLNLGKPLQFNKNEKHSFMEWLQLTNQKKFEKPLPKEQEKEQKKKFELLDKFIQSNPKIIPVEKLESEVDISESTSIAKNELMTETLARVYLEQKKYKKAIKAFKTLSLKYPEKSSFFADQIEAIKRLRKDKD
ncbi:hypothetical protein [Croceivirga lutea]|uniref:hypothetical protein n=1 Tax=Croceivirga lutea TaxID=1775167 RepID=UPI0028BF4CCA|nr:hypothetical protein [Croceivirga lutea]